MSVVPSSEAPLVLPSLLSNDMDAGAQRRWTAWKARGVAQDIAIRRRFKVLALIVVFTVGAAAMVRFLFA